MNRLRLCEGCSRHVLESEAVCPFCQEALAPLQLPAAVRLPPGLSRAQRLALAAAAVAGQAIAACTADGDPGMTTVPVYGVPISGSPSPAGARATTGGNGGKAASGGAGVVAVPVYGAPLAGTQSVPVQKPDAGVVDAGDEDAGVPADAGKTDAGPTVHPVYGAPVPVYGAPLPQK